MTSRKYFFLLSGVLALLILVILAGTVGGNIILQKQAKKLLDLKLENATIEMQQTALTQAKKDVERYSEIDSIARSVVPQDKDQAKTVREIVQIAQENKIPIKSVSFEASNLGVVAPKAPAANPDDKTTETAPKTPAVPAVSQVKPVDGIPGVFTLPIQVASDGKVSYQNFLRFLESLETNRRTAHVSAINIEPDEDGTSLTFNLTLNAYVKP